MTQAWDFVDAAILWQAKRALLDMSWEELILSARVENCLQNHNEYHPDDKILTIRDLVRRKDYELWRLPNLGKVSIAEIKSVLAEHGLTLASDRV